jgi:hypothetical protein
MKYLNAIKIREQFNENADIDTTKYIDIYNCPNCNVSLFNCDDSYVCQHCGFIYDKLLDTSIDTDYSMPNRRYERINHFKDYLKRFQKINKLFLPIDVIEKCCYTFNIINNAYNNDLNNRSKMLNYNYILLKIFQIIHLHHYTKYIKPIKCKKILIKYEEIWENIQKTLSFI